MSRQYIQTCWSTLVNFPVVFRFFQMFEQLFPMSTFLLEKNKIEDSKVWLICPLDINSSDCDLFNYKKKNLFVLEQKQFNSIILKLIQLDIKNN